MPSNIWNTDIPLTPFLILICHCWWEIQFHVNSVYPSNNFTAWTHWRQCHWRFGGRTYGERGARGYNGGLKAETPAGFRGRAPGQRVREASPLEAESVRTLDVQLKRKLSCLSPYFANSVLLISATQYPDRTWQNLTFKVWMNFFITKENNKSHFLCKTIVAIDRHILPKILIRTSLQLTTHS